MIFLFILYSLLKNKVDISNKSEGIISGAKNILNNSDNDPSFWMIFLSLKNLFSSSGKNNS